MVAPPRVFISYSHDSPDHRRWVLGLGSKLRESGIDVTLDQWDLRLGEDITQFMEEGVTHADRVLVICTPQYVQKANDGVGGVGYERLIVTASLVQDLGTIKFIPILREASTTPSAPTFLRTRNYIDFSDDDTYEERLTELIHELHQNPLTNKPPLGRSPFSSPSSTRVATPTVSALTQPISIPEKPSSASDHYRIASDLVRASDLLGWRQLTKRLPSSVVSGLLQLRKDRIGDRPPQGHDDLFEVVDEAVSIASPIICIALAGVESGREQFREQKALLSELLYIPDWERSGYSAWIDIPYAIGYIYHSMHGAISLSTNQMESAISLAKYKVLIRHSGSYTELWRESNLMGWSESFGGNCTSGWDYLASACSRLDWVGEIFGDELEYKTALVAYYMALSIHNLAWLRKSGKSSKDLSPIDISVPLLFLSEESEVNRRAVSLLFANPKETERIWGVAGVTRKQMTDWWDTWIDVCRQWTMSVVRRPFYDDEQPYKQFFHAFPST